MEKFGKLSCMNMLGWHDPLLVQVREMPAIGPCSKEQQCLKTEICAKAT